MATTRNIFLVDDDALHSQMLSDHLKQHFTAHITSFSTGEACLLQIDQKPDVVILDFHLNTENPEAQNGLEILRSIKKKNKKCEVVMLSGQDNINVALDTMKYGAHDYVIKNESGFIRTQNAINNVFDKLDRGDRLQMFVMSTVVLATILGCIAVYYLVYLLFSGF